MCLKLKKVPCEDSDKMVYSLGLILAGLCIARCNDSSCKPVIYKRGFATDMKRQLIFYEGEVKKQEEEVHTWDGKFDTDPSKTFPNLVHFANHSGLPLLSQSVNEDFLFDLQNCHPTQRPYFFWYSKSSESWLQGFNAHCSVAHAAFSENLDWNSRVIVMDLLLKLAEKPKDEQALHVLHALFPVIPHLDEELNALNNRSLAIFWAQFWLPAIHNFCSVFDDRIIEKEDAAIEEVCHVLGITCRTQWMKAGFISRPLDQSALKCRYERLLTMLSEPSGVKLKQNFVENMHLVYQKLKKRELKELKCVQALPKKLYDDYFYQESGQFFLLHEWVVDWNLRDVGTNIIDDHRIDPRRVVDVRRYSLLDLS
jgi:hypothetical protein